MLSQITILIVLIFLSGFFSAAEIAFFSLSPIRVRYLLDKKIKHAKTLAKVKKNPRQLLIAILIGNNLVNIGAASLATVLAIKTFGSIGAGIATGVMTFLILMFGEIIPKSIAVAQAEKYALKISRIFLYLMYVLYPLIVVLEFIVIKLFKNLDQKVSTRVSEDYVKAVAKMGAEQGAVEAGERELIERVFKFNDITARDVMTRRMDVVAWPAKDKIFECLEKINNCPYSRVPIYKESIDNIVGIVYIKDVLKVVSTQLAKDLIFTDIARPAIFIPYTKIIDDLLKEFQSKKIHLAIVVDDQGLVEGLVTLEDVLEELVGEIIDESDIESSLIRRVDRQTIEADGATELRAVGQFFNIDLPGLDTDTVSAMVLKQSGKILQVGEKIKLDNNITVEIIKADEKVVKRVKISK